MRRRPISSSLPRIDTYGRIFPISSRAVMSQGREPSELLNRREFLLLAASAAAAHAQGVASREVKPPFNPPDNTMS
jgi:hypothetical protein